MAKNLYVDAATGNDATTYANNNSGSPWATLTKACAEALAGDTVYVIAGTYTGTGTNNKQTPAFNPTNSGNAVDGYITFKAVGTVNLTETNTGPVFGTYSKDYIIWDGFSADESDHTMYDGEPSPVVIWPGDHVIIQNCTLKGDYEFSSGVNHSAIRMEGASNCLIKNNRCYNFTGADGGNEGVFYFYGSTDIIIEHNEVYDSIMPFYVKGILWGTDQNNERIIFRYNLFHDLSDGGKIGVSSIDGRFYQNVFYDVGQAFIIWVGTIEDCDTSGNIVANNTMDINTDVTSSINFIDNEESVILKNNIITRSTRRVIGSTTVASGDCISIFDTNIYYTYTTFMAFTDGNKTFAQWQALGKDTNSSTNDPLFVNAATHNYKLQSGSYALTHGIDILDLDNDTLTNDTIPAGAYITGYEQIGLQKKNKLLGSSLSGCKKINGVATNSMNEILGVSINR